MTFGGIAGVCCEHGTMGPCWRCGDAEIARLRAFGIELHAEVERLRPFVSGVKKLIDGARVRDGHSTVKTAALNRLLNSAGVR